MHMAMWVPPPYQSCKTWSWYLGVPWMTVFLPPQKLSKVSRPLRHTSQLLSAALAPQKAPSQTKRRSCPINAAPCEPRPQNTWGQPKDRRDPRPVTKLPSLPLQHRSAISIASKHTSNLQICMLTRTGYPGFLCSKDVWVILNLSVSILVPLWEWTIFNYLYYLCSSYGHSFVLHC